MSVGWENLELEPAGEFVGVSTQPPAARQCTEHRAGAGARSGVHGFGGATGYRCLILTGAGERAFCAGADLKDRLGMDLAAWEAQHRAFQQAARRCAPADPDHRRGQRRGLRRRPSWR